MRRRPNPYRALYSDKQNDIADTIIVVFACVVLVLIYTGVLT